MHVVIVCILSLFVGFTAGALYGKLIAHLVVSEFTKEMAAATSELKKLRGEIFQERTNSGK